MKTAFIIRMHYKKNDPRWSWRLAYFKSMVLPKILAQTDQDFDICMRVSEHHKEEVAPLSDKIKFFDAKKNYKHYIKPGYAYKRKKYFVDFLDYNMIDGLDKYDIQIGIDTDDMILRTDFVERIKQECLLKPEKSLHIGFQPHIFQPSTLRMFKCPQRYDDSRGSPVFVLYQPLKFYSKKYIFAYEDSHLKLPRYMDRKKRIEEDFCCYSVHECNASTGLPTYPQQILV